MRRIGSVAWTAFFLILRALQATAADATTQFVYINGGYDTYGNYSVHEQDLLAFRNDLFKTGNAAQIHILNAGGPGTRVNMIRPDGYFERDSSGWDVTAPSLVPEKYDAATPENVDKLFRDLVATNPPNLTVVYGDHGGPGGVYLWNQQEYSPNQIQANYSRFAAGTLVRAIHLHCFGGASMLRSDRRMPDKPEQVESYFQKFFPENRCAVSMSREFEVGQYYSWKDSWDHGRWHELLPGLKPPTLAALKDAFDHDARLNPSPVLTSDYFLGDLSAYFCESVDQRGLSPAHAFDEIAACLPAVEETPVLGQLFTEAHQALCVEQRAISHEILKTIADFKNSLAVNTDLQNLRSYWKYEYLKATHPAMIQSFEDASAKIDRLMKKIALGKLSPTEKSAVISEAGKVRDDAPTRLQLSLQSLSPGGGQGGLFAAYFARHCTDEWLRSKRADYPNFAAFRFSGPPGTQDYTYSQLDNYIRDGADTIQKSIKNKFNKLSRERRSVIERLLQDPHLSTVKKLYENIKACENSTLN